MINQKLINTASLGPAAEPELPGELLPTTFPHHIEEVLGRNPLPFSMETFKLITQTFRLQAATPWNILTESSHFQEYSAVSGSTTPLLGKMTHHSRFG